MTMQPYLHCPCCGEAIFEGVARFTDVSGLIVLEDNVLSGPLGKVKCRRQLQLLFKALLAARGGLVSAQVLYDMLYWDVPEDRQPDPSIMRVRLSQCRQKARAVGAVIENVAGRGYRLSANPAVAVDHPVKPGDDKLGVSGDDKRQSSRTQQPVIARGRDRDRARFPATQKSMARHSKSHVERSDAQDLEQQR